MPRTQRYLFFCIVPVVSLGSRNKEVVDSEVTFHVEGPLVVGWIGPGPEGRLPRRALTGQELTKQ